jgi:HSP20 family protein
VLNIELHGVTFMRQLSLGEGIDSDRINATYANGVLTLTIPVAERAKPRRIQVTSTSTSTSEATTIDAKQQAEIAG